MKTVIRTVMYREQIFLFPSSLKNEGRTYRQAEPVFYKFAVTGNRSALRLPGSFRRRDLQSALLQHVTKVTGNIAAKILRMKVVLAKNIHADKL